MILLRTSIGATVALAAGAFGCAGPSQYTVKHDAVRAESSPRDLAPASAPLESVKQTRGVPQASAVSRPRRKPVFEGTGVLMAPKPLEGKNPAPVYPEASRLAGESGVVVVRVTVSEEGMPVEMRIEESSSFTRLDAAAVEAAARWRFKPGTWQGKPVELDILVPFRFGLKEPAKP